MVLSGQQRLRCRFFELTFEEKGMAGMLDRERECAVDQPDHDDDVLAE